jgi:signal transduction histidine kinase
MLTNLLDNAVKFTTAGEIRVRVAERGEEVVFEVQDTGVGIGPKDLEHVFEPFWQAQQSTTREIGGSGLGLAVTQRLTRLLGGTVTAESELGKGSTFRIALPKNPVGPSTDARTR